MKQKYRIYIEPEDYRKLIHKAELMGYTGKGKLSYFLSRVAREPLIFADDNLKAFLEMVQAPKTAPKE